MVYVDTSIALALFVPEARSAVVKAWFAAAADLVRDASSGLRAGDALHLAVAREIGAVQIATLDATLAANAQSQGIRPVVFADL